MLLRRSLIVSLTDEELRRYVLCYLYSSEGSGNQRISGVELMEFLEVGEGYLNELLRVLVERGLVELHGEPWMEVSLTPEGISELDARVRSYRPDH
jgi:DNA-binding MarR family transcriptional regulator